MTFNYQNFSNTLHQEADVLLKKTDLVKKLLKYGEVVVSGSYAMDLMMDGDIDLFIINKDLNKKRSIEILNDLIIQNDFNGYLYYDWTERKHIGFPKGFYIGLKTDFKGRKWKVDVWMINEIFKPTEKLMNLVRTNLNEKNKKQILKLKYQAKAKNLGVRSSEIYFKVLKG
ncbi:MAG: hypothetical protein ACOYMB_02210 [Patescibacteria group bacterium]